jgi:hypothetical protein
MLRILIIDESQSRAAELSGGLVIAGHQVAAVLPSALDLTAQIERIKPDVILIETDSPSRDTLENLAVMDRDMPCLFAHAPEPVLEINARDMEWRNLVDGDLVRIKGKRGNLVRRAPASSTLRPAQTWLPMHWGGRFMRGLGINALMPPVTDPAPACRSCGGCWGLPERVPEMNSGLQRA